MELTATERCGIQRYTFPEAKSAIILNLKKAMNWDATQDSYVEVVDSVTIRGYRFSDGWARKQKVFFQTRFSVPFENVQMDTTPILKDNLPMGTAYVARFDFSTKKDEQIIVSTAISGVSMEGAAKNLLAEVPENDFEKYRLLAKETWNKELSKIKVESEDKDDKTVFYTALYHSMLAPTIIRMSTDNITDRIRRYIRQRTGPITVRSLFGIRSVPHIRCLLIRNRNGPMI